MRYQSLTSRLINAARHKVCFEYAPRMHNCLTQIVFCSFSNRTLTETAVNLTARLVLCDVDICGPRNSFSVCLLLFHSTPLVSMHANWALIPLFCVRGNASLLVICHHHTTLARTNRFRAKERLFFNFEPRIMSTVKSVVYCVCSFSRRDVCHRFILITAFHRNVRESSQLLQPETQAGLLQVSAGPLCLQGLFSCYVLAWGGIALFSKELK